MLTVLPLGLCRQLSRLFLVQHSRGICRAYRWVPLVYNCFGYSLLIFFLILTAMHLIFRFITGFAGSAFLSIVGGSASDMFTNVEVGP